MIRLYFYLFYVLVIIVVLPCILVLTGNNNKSVVGYKLNYEPMNDLKIFNENSLQLMQNKKIPTGIEYAGIQKLWEQGYKGKGITVGIVDSGVDKNHKEFKSTNIVRKNKIPDEFDGSNIHGTHVAGTIAANGLKIQGAAPECKIIDYRIFANEETNKKADKVSGDVGLLISSLDEAFNDGCSIINLSLGISQDLSSIRNAITRAYKKGVTIICAAGNKANNEDNEINYPAAYKNVISVGAFKIDGKNNIEKADFSMNSNNNIWADGVKVFSTIPKDQYGLLSGTSMASPLVTGAIASYFSFLKGKGIEPKPKHAFDFINKNSKVVNGLKILTLEKFDKLTAKGIVEIEILE